MKALAWALALTSTSTSTSRFSFEFGNQILKKSSMKQECWNETLAWLSFLGVSAIFRFWLFLLVPFGSFLFHVFILFSRRHALNRWKRAQRRHCKFGNDSKSRLWLLECVDGADYGFDGVDNLSFFFLAGLMILMDLDGFWDMHA